MISALFKLVLAATLFIQVPANYAIAGKSAPPVLPSAYRASIVAAELAEVKDLEHLLAKYEKHFSAEEMAGVRAILKDNKVDLSQKIGSVKQVKNKLVFENKDAIEVFDDGRVSIGGVFLKPNQSADMLLKQVLLSSKAENAHYLYQLLVSDAHAVVPFVVGWKTITIIVGMLIGAGKIGYDTAMASIGLQATCKDGDLKLISSKNSTTKQILFKFKEDELVGYEFFGSLTNLDKSQIENESALNEVKFLETVHKSCMKKSNKILDAEEVRKIAKNSNAGDAQRSFETGTAELGKAAQ